MRERKCARDKFANVKPPLQIAGFAELVDEVAPCDSGNNAVQRKEKVEGFLERVGRKALQDFFCKGKSCALFKRLEATDDIFVFAGKGFRFPTRSQSKIGA